MSRYLVEMADWFRAAGLAYVEYGGWKQRARSSGGYGDGRPWGIMWHHTASNTTPDRDASYMCHGSPDRPIANLLIARDGVVWILAAGATNTNGKGGPWAWSRGTIPRDSMNTYAVGIELANNGVGGTYPQPQIDAAFTASTVLCERLGLAADDVCQHVNYAPLRKIDPATAVAVHGPWRPRSANSAGSWDLESLLAEHRRRMLGTHPPPEGFLMALTDQQQADLYNRIMGSTPGPYTDDQRGLGGSGDGHRRYGLDDQDGAHIVELLERIAAKLEGKR